MRVVVRQGFYCIHNNITLHGPHMGRDKDIPVSRFEYVSGLSVYPVEIRSVNNLSSSEDCSTDDFQPV